MGAKHFTELEVWQLADDLRGFIHDLTETGPAARAFKYRDQIRSASDSVCDNTAEGFGRYRHRGFSRFLEIANGSLNECESELLGGRRKRFFSEEQIAVGRGKIEHTRRALQGLKSYLDSTDAPPRSD